MKYETKFYLLSNVFEHLNRYIPSQPHERLAGKLPKSFKSDSKLLDLCTGTGYGARVIAKQHPTSHITGIDLSQDMLRVGHRIIDKENLKNISLIHADASSLPFENETFDIITVVFGLHELPTDIRTKAVKECFRVLKPNGQYIIADLDKPGVWYGSILSLYLLIGEPTYAKGILKPELEALLHSSGFCIGERSYGLKGFIQYITAHKN